MSRLDGLKDLVKPKLVLKRYKSENKQTLGKLHLTKDSFLYTLELPWKNNQKKISCIPEGVYTVVPRTSPKYGNHFHILNIPNRDFVLFHSGNHFFQIEGCVLVGLGLGDINKDGYLDVTNSKSAMKILLENYPNGFILEIIDEYKINAI